MMNRTSLICLSLAVVSAALAPVAAHNGDRVFPIRYLSEETLALLNRDDGVVEDWLDFLGEPTLTSLDFNLWTGIPMTSSFDRHDPGSLDFRIWMGWTSDGRIHVAGQFVDDVYVNEYDPLVEPNLYPHVHDSVSLLVDGDHTGGQYFWIQSHSELEVQTNRQAQFYENIAIAPSDQRVVLYKTSVGAIGFDEIEQPVDWMVQPPYARGGGGVFGENPTMLYRRTGKPNFTRILQSPRATKGSFCIRHQLGRSVSTRSSSRWTGWCSPPTPGVEEACSGRTPPSG